jgi:hypothetical protein
MKKNRFFRIAAVMLLFGLVLAGCKDPDDDNTPVGSTVINDLVLTGRVTAPVKNATPVTTFSETSQYSGTIVWQTAEGAPVSGSFTAGTVYKAVVLLSAKSGFTFTGVAANAFTYSGATVTNAANSGTVTITFPATVAAGEEENVTIDSLANDLDLLPDNDSSTPHTIVFASFTIDNEDTDPDGAWASVNEATNSARRYVILDLSACTAANNTISGVSITSQISQKPNALNNIYNNSFVKGIILPASLTAIGNSAFYGCAALTSISIPAGVTSIGNHAFYSCAALTSITVDSANSTYTSQDGVLFNKNQTTLIQYPAGKSGASYTIPAGVTSIRNYAFENCAALTSITLPAGVTSIGDSAFRGCTALTSISIPAGVTSIGTGAFMGCTALTSISIPAGVTSIGTGAFYGCAALTSISIPAGVTSIGESAFEGCAALTSISIPVSVTSIGNGAFMGCAALTSITVDSANSIYTSQNEVLFNKTQTTLIQYPAGKSEASYTIPAGVTSIRNYAFENCAALTSITLPADVATIGDYAFSRCTALTSVTFAEGSTIDDEQFGGNVFPQGSNGTGGDNLRTSYLSGGAGTYTRLANGSSWTKQ